ncbi:hypothetical protein CK203_007339 [Vitis vinifera]|uniref:Uncharacterized protein n=1 Tax=Vitis vinifera TaxID=29760 RepID=A0A438G0Q3_VITVI|nr:hypothetical protein CK203_007339 [Vitis vinifera]
MRKFDPWPVFFRREWNRNWPFLVGFAVTGTIITVYSLSLTEEDAKKSPFVQRHERSVVSHCLLLSYFIAPSPLNLFENYEENYQRSQVNFCKPMEYLQIHALFGRKGKTCFCFPGV